MSERATAQAKVRSEGVVPIVPNLVEAGSAWDREREDCVIAEAMAILDRRMFRRGPPLASPRQVGQYLKIKLAQYPYEVFAAAFLDNRMRLICFKELFRGSVDGASVPVREVVRECITHNAVYLIVGHQHPSGVPEPSAADRSVTRQLKDALALVDVRLLDHYIIGEGEPVSMAARAMI